MNNQVSKRLSCISRLFELHNNGLITKSELQKMTEEFLQEIRCIYSNGID